MRRLLIGISILTGVVATALAADLPVYTKAPPARPPAWSWTGFYLGLQGGSGWGTTQQICSGGFCGPIVPVPGLFQTNYGLNGVHGGGTAGFNWQTGPVVLGVEADISAANINGSGDCSSAFGGSNNASCQTNMSWFGTATGRVGVTVNYALLYVKAGGAWAHFNHNILSSSNDISPIVTTASLGDDRSGYTLGAGIEYAFWRGWSAKVEYDFMDFGSKNLALPFINSASSLTGIAFANDREQVHVVKVGLNYRFNW
jgi:outer membrane immunogenic protein